MNEKGSRFPTWSLLMAKGVLIGMSDSVPGVSGGTIAVLTGIYDRLIAALSSLDLTALRLLLGGELRRAWERVDGFFLLPLALGMLGGLLISANTVLYALEHYPIHLGGFFIGLVIGALVLLRHEYRLTEFWGVLLLLLGFFCSLGLAWVRPGATHDSVLFLFMAGAIAISAMLLPGLSGAFLLILLGVYEPMLAAVVEFNVLPLAIFALGCAVGLLVFSRLLDWVLHRYRGQTYSLICGLLLGSLSVIWPWRVDMQPVWPTDFAIASGGSAELNAALVVGFSGVCLVLVLHWFFERFHSAAD